MLRIRVALILVVIFLLPVMVLPEGSLRHVEIISPVSLTILVNVAVAGTLLVTQLLSRTSILAFMHVLAVWLMLCWAAWIRYLTQAINSSFFGFHSDESILTSNAIILLWVVTFVPAYKLFLARLQKRPSREPLLVSPLGIKLQLVVGFLTLGYILLRTGFGIFTRSAFEEAFIVESTIEGLLLLIPLRMASVYALSAVLFSFKASEKTAHRVTMALNAALIGIAILVLNNPVAGSRFFTASVLVGWLYSFVLRKRKEPIFPLFIAILIGVFGFLPLDFGRYQSGAREALDVIELSAQHHVTGDSFRAYEAMPGTVDYVENYGHESFFQLVGNMLFFIPRSVWPEKPGGSGDLIAVTYGLKFTNIATPLPAEGYINFGFLGVIALAVGFAFVVALLDHLNERTQSHDGVPVYQVFFGFLLGNMFFLTRGDLLSPFAYTVSMALGGIVLLMTSKRAPPQDLRRP